MKTCLHFGICGGCTLQDIDYSAELERKQAWIKTLFPEESVLPIMGSSDIFQYRNKMEFSFSESRAGLHFLGLNMKRGKVVDLEECFLTSSWMMEVLKVIRAWWQKWSLEAYFPPKDKGLLRNLTLREGKRTGEKMAVLTLAGMSGLNEQQKESLKEGLLGVTSFSSICLRKQIAEKKKPTYFIEEVLHGQNFIHEILFDDEGHALRFKIRPSSFFQPNTIQAERLIQKAIALSELTQSDSFFDLYCGTGTIGIFASKKGGEGIGIEFNPDAVFDGEENLKYNNINNLRLIQGDVAAVFPKESHPKVIFVDPPRAGLAAQTIEHLKKIAAHKIIYISCNPETQARDVALLSDMYRIQVIQPIDQFPRTPHVENIVALKINV